MYTKNINVSLLNIIMTKKSYRKYYFAPMTNLLFFDVKGKYHHFTILIHSTNKVSIFSFIFSIN